MSIIKSHDVTLYGGNDEFNIVLKPLCDEHLSYLYKWYSDLDVLYWTETDDVNEPYSTETVHEIYGGVSQNALCFLIEANGLVIGECWLQKMNMPNVIAMYPKNTDVRRIDMAIGEKDYWNRGIGTQLIRILVDFAFNGEQVEAFHCFCEEYNKRSQRVWGKNGFILEHKIKHDHNQKSSYEYHYVLTRRQYIQNHRVRVSDDKVFMLPISDVQPSQLYISSGKLKLVKEWFDKTDISEMDAIPIKKFQGRNLMTDGHTRAVAAYIHGLREIPCYLDTDELDMAAYATDIAWCNKERIFGIADLANRIVPHKEYELLWRKRCLDMYNEALYVLWQKAVHIIGYINTLPEVNSCTVYGSLLNGNADEYSDIDIDVDVSGSDNSIFIKHFPGFLSKKFSVIWYDYAPSLMPDKYIVSVAIDEANPFCVVDLKCTAVPHKQTFKKSDFENDAFSHSLKLWIANCKHFIRGMACSDDIKKMGRRVIGSETDTLSDEATLEEVLYRLEENKTSRTEVYIANCRKVWEQR